MKRLYYLIFLSFLSGCSKVYKMGGHGSNEHNLPDSIAEVLDISQEACVNPRFTSAEGYSLSFAMKNKLWIATVYEEVFPFSRTKDYPVFFEAGFCLCSLLNYEPEQRKNFIHVIPASDGQHIVCVGRFGLQGGGLVQSVEKTQNYQYCKKNIFFGNYECFQCKYAYKGPIKSVKDSLNIHFCAKEGCGNCLMLRQNQCKTYHSITKKLCKECCSCDQRKIFNQSKKINQRRPSIW